MNKYTLKALINPCWWVRNNPISRDLDKVYRYLLDHKDEVKVINCGSVHPSPVVQGSSVQRLVG